jgi:hypothetical protein
MDRIPLIEVLGVYEMRSSFFKHPRTEIEEAYKAHNRGKPPAQHVQQFCTSFSKEREEIGYGWGGGYSWGGGWLPRGWTQDAQEGFDWTDDTAAFEVYTVPEGYNSGRVFCFRSASVETNAGQKILKSQYLVDF